MSRRWTDDGARTMAMSFHPVRALAAGAEPRALDVPRPATASLRRQ